MTKKSDNGNGGDYKVGYKKPPKHTQFKKGQSGNRKGRPKGSKNAKQLAHEIANELVMVRDKNGKLIEKTRFGLLLENLTTSGIKLDVPAARLVFNILKTTGYLDEPDKSDTRKSGVLLMPAPMTKEEWIERYAKKPNDEKS